MMTPHTPLLQKRHEKSKCQDLFTLIYRSAAERLGSGLLRHPAYNK